MALHLRAKRPFITKLTGSLVAIGALLFQPFGVLPSPVADAVGLTIAAMNPVLTVSTASGKLLENGEVTKSYGIVANWSQPSPDTTSYIYKYWNDISGNQYKQASPYTVEITGNSQPGVFDQGEGTHYLQVVAVNAAGNQSGGSNVFEVDYDATAPVATISSPAEGQSLSSEDSDGKILVVGSFTDNNKRNTLQVELVRAGVIIAKNTVDGSQLTGDDYMTEFDVSAQPNGEYGIFYTATDMAGNVSERLERKFSLNNLGSPIVITPIDGETEPGPANETPVNNAPADTTDTSGGSGANNTPLSSLPLMAQPAVLPGLSSTFVAAINNAVGSTAENSTAETGDVLGTSTTEPKDIAAVAGVSDRTGWSLGSLTWYGWVAAVIGLTGLWLLIAAASRRLRGAES